MLTKFSCCSLKFLIHLRFKLCFNFQEWFLFNCKGSELIFGNKINIPFLIIVTITTILARLVVRLQCLFFDVLTGNVRPVLLFGHIFHCHLSVTHLLIFVLCLCEKWHLEDVIDKKYMIFCQRRNPVIKNWKNCEIFEIRLINKYILLMDFFFHDLQNQNTAI